MGKRPVLYLLPLILLLVLFSISVAQAADGVVYQVKIDGEINPGMANFLERAVTEAKQGGAELIIVEFDTPGGLLDSAHKMSAQLINSEIPCVAFINKTALSAGAYLALSCDYIYMTPGSTMGAAEARAIGSSEPADEKVLSAWEGAMRSVAETAGRDPLLAAAMVRRDISVEGLVGAGELLTFTPAKALEWGYSEGTVDNISDLLIELDMEGVTLREVAPTRGEQLAGFLTNPVVATVLLTLGLAALVIEFFTSGFGLFGVISITAFVLYFGGSMLAGQSGYEVILFFLLGLVLIVIEVFIPGFGIFGISGLLSLTSAIVLAAASTQLGLLMLLISLVAASALIYLAFRFLDHRGFMDYFILRNKADRESGYTSHSDYSELTGKEGQTLTPLRPAGTALFGDKRMDVISEGGYIPASTRVRVVDTAGGRIIVRKAE